MSPWPFPARLNSPECPTASTSMGNEPLRRESSASLSAARRTEPSRRNRNQDSECFISPLTSSSFAACCCCSSNCVCGAVQPLNVDSSVRTGFKMSAPPDERRRRIFLRFLADLFPATPELRPTINKLSVGMELLRFTFSGTDSLASGPPLAAQDEEAACCVFITLADLDSYFSSVSIGSASDDEGN